MSLRSPRVREGEVLGHTRAERPTAMNLNAFPPGLAELATIFTLSTAQCEDLARRFPGEDFSGLAAALSQPGIAEHLGELCRVLLASGPNAALAQIDRILRQQVREQQPIRQPEERPRGDERGGRGR
uniref:Uncharacterized protein n=1 Tax=mine drainage metagenome TaxID=410659 RepID=E6PJA7_9ZZZZ